MMTFAVEFETGRSLTRAQQSLRWATTIDMGHKEGAAVPLSRCGELHGYPSNTMWPGPRSTSVPSGVFIHAAVWPQ